MEDSIQDAQDRFACPFRTRDPRKYSIKNSIICSLRWFSSLRQLTSHLYRYHRLFQCSRCKTIYQSEEELHAHTADTTGCELSSTPMSDGIKHNMLSELMSRATGRGGMGGSLEDGWKDIYRYLFPLEEVPSPYYNPLGGDVEPNRGAFTEYADHLRRELPIVFRSTIEAIPQFHPLIADFNLEEVLRKCLESAASNYQGDSHVLRGSYPSLSPRADSNCLSPKWFNPYGVLEQSETSEAPDMNILRGQDPCSPRASKDSSSIEVVDSGGPSHDTDCSIEERSKITASIGSFPASNLPQPLKTTKSNSRCSSKKRKESVLAKDTQDSEKRRKLLDVSTSGHNEIIGETEDKGFACPYRKYCPRKYNIKDWGSCVLTHRSTIARIKDHLYRFHSIHQCPRCNNTFSDEQKLNDHINAVQACAVAKYQDGGTNGINRSLRDTIRGKKKLFPGQSKRQEWEHIYNLLFPGEPLPDSPYWDDPDKLDSFIVDNYSKYLINELPPILRRSLESYAGDEPSPKERYIIDQAVTLVPAALHIVHDVYQGTQDPNPSREDLDLHQSLVAAASINGPSIVATRPEAMHVHEHIRLDYDSSLWPPEVDQSTVNDNFPSLTNSIYCSGASNFHDSLSDTPTEQDKNTTQAGFEIESQRIGQPWQPYVMTEDAMSCDNLFPLRMIDDGVPGIPINPWIEDETFAKCQTSLALSCNTKDLPGENRILPVNIPPTEEQASRTDLMKIDDSSLDWDAVMQSLASP